MLLSDRGCGIGSTTVWGYHTVERLLLMYGNVKSRRGGFRQGRSFNGSNRRSKSTIHSSQFINKAVEEIDQLPEVTRHQTFRDFSLDARILAAVERRGYQKPTPIQDAAIPLVIAGRDVIGVAETGTGKTAAFLLPILHHFLTGSNGCAFIVVPTRELAVQIEEELRSFARNFPVRSALCIGGAGFGSQLNALSRRPNFIIGTPGRLKDHLQRRTLPVNQVSHLVLDEADRMVEMGFIDDVRTLISALPTRRQSLFFSATITDEVRGLIAAFTENPEKVSVKRRETSQNVDQDVIRFTDQFHKLTLLHDLLVQQEVEKVLVFGRTKHGVEKLCNTLVERGFKAVSIHGNKTQTQRQRSLRDFKENRAQVLVATDVAARGLDIPNVTHVINYDAPENFADYVHRIGRTGRANNKGKAYTFVGFGG